MAQFLTTISANKQLERMILHASRRLIIVQPFLKLHPRLMELLEGKVDHVEITLLYGRSRMDADEVRWLSAHPSIHTRKLVYLHGKCILTETAAYLGTQNLHEFGDNRRYEMGMLVMREEEPELYKSIAEEVHREIGDSRDIPPAVFTPVQESHTYNITPPRAGGLIPDWQLAQQHGLTIGKLYDLLVENRLLAREKERNRFSLTPKGKAAGGQPGFSKRYGPYFRWPDNLELGEPAGGAAKLISRFW